MNKKELIEQMANCAEITKTEAECALGGILDTITSSLQNEEKVSLVGFGTFSVSERNGRIGRNPQTGKTIQIPAKKVVRFKVGKKLANAVK